MRSEVKLLATVAGGCAALIAAASLLNRGEQTPAFTPSREAPKERASAESERPATADSRVRFAQSMPASSGTPIINTTGKVNLDAVQVAVVDAAGKIRMLPGTDSRAVEYLAAVEAGQATNATEASTSDVESKSIPARRQSGGQGARKVKLNPVKLGFGS
jgi:hypothetical protein